MRAGTLAGLRAFVVVGAAGSGKTTVARKIAKFTGLAFVDLDEIYHRPNWTYPESEEFRSDVSKKLDVADLAKGGWAVAGNYTAQIAPMLHPKADVFVWLDFSRRRVMWQVVTRTIWRALLRKKLYNGNRESFRSLFSLRSDRNIILWSWSTFESTRELFSLKSRNGSWAHGQVHHIKTKRELKQFLEELGKATTGDSVAVPKVSLDS